MVYLSPDSTIKVKADPENYFQTTSRKSDWSMSWLMVLLSVWMVSAVILLSAPRVVKVLGHRGV